MDTNFNNDFHVNIIKFLDLHYSNNRIKFFYANIDMFVMNFLPFVHLVNYWSQILALVISSCPDPKKRKMIIKNLYEENCEEYSHVETFLLFIEEEIWV